MIFVVLFICSAGGGVQGRPLAVVHTGCSLGQPLRVNSIYGVINSANMIVAPAVAAVLINTVLWSILLVDVTTAIIGVGFVALIKAPKKSGTCCEARLKRGSGNPHSNRCRMPMLIVRWLPASVVFADLKDGFSTHGAGRTCATWAR